MKGRVVVRIVVSRCFSCRRRQAPSGGSRRWATFLLTESHLTNPRSVLWALIVLACFGSEVKLSVMESYSRVCRPEPCTWKSPRACTLIRSWTPCVASSQGRGIPEVIGSLSNHDGRDDDDVKYARRDWDEVAFSGKMKHKQRGCSRTTTKEFLSDSLRIWRGHRLFHLSHRQSFISDEEFVILVAFRAKKSWVFVSLRS